MSYLVAIVGRPNTGKSTLFNRLTRTRKAIVDSTPGVTRDRNYAEVTWDEKEFTLVDTGGFESEDSGEIISKMQGQTTLAMEEADAIILLLDGRGGPAPPDYEAVSRLRRVNKPVLYVVNKIDGPEQEERLLPDFYRLGVEPLYSVSAEHAYGIRDFMEALLAFIPEQKEEGAGEDLIRISVVGRPNVGKSSLVNRLLGEERMLVTDVPGTTRDSIDTLFEVSGRKYCLIDTAGVRRKSRVGGHLEKFSVIKALKSLSECDIALSVLDAGEGITDQDARILGYISEKNKGCILIVNKWDLLKDRDDLKKRIKTEIRAQTVFISYAPLLNISALTGCNTKRILSLAETVYGQYTARISTSKLNEALRELVSQHEPPASRGRRIKLYYATQTAIKPPTFLIFANYPDSIPTSYQRYIVNQLRETLALEKAPIRIVLRQRERRGS
ncbi:MAG: ribosome biogenesis GTPase Der [Pseudomonadota bacterium]